MKKIFSAAVTVMLIGCMLMTSGCGKNKNERAHLVEGDKTETSNQTVNESDDAEDPGKSGKDAAQKASEQAQDKAAADSDISMGTVSDNTYKNEYFKLACKLDSAWTFSSSSELLSAVNINADGLSADELTEKIKSVGMFYDMAASKQGGIPNISVGIQNVDMVYGSGISEEEIIDKTVSSLPAQMEKAGISVEQCEASKTEFAGAQRNTIKTLIAQNGMKIYQTQVFVKKDSYMFAAAFTSDSFETNENLIKMFYKLN